MARTMIIGDVHGMLPELERLLGLLAPTHDDTLVFVGDLVDKGPSSASTVTYLRKMREGGYNVVLVRGNHEEKHERFRAAYAKAGDKVKMKGVEEMKAITAELTEADIAFLESAVMFHQIPEHNAIVVHAGILPTMESLPTDKELAAMSKGELSKLARILRVRHVTGNHKAKITVEIELGGYSAEDLEQVFPGRFAGDDLLASAKVLKKRVRPAGSFISLGQETEGDPFWAEVYGTDERGPRFGHVYFGHSPFIGSEPVRFPHATGLDTGAVFGGSLTAAVLVSGQDPAFVSVPASGKYATSLWED